MSCRSLTENGDDYVRPFSRSDVYYDRDVEKLAAHFDKDGNGRRASIQAMNLYRKSVSSIASVEDNFGRRLSVLSTTISELPKNEGSSTMKDPPPKAASFNLLPKGRLLTNPKFHVFMMHGFFHFMALYVPFQFLPSQILSVGLSHTTAGRVMSTMAFAGLIGRLICGFLMDHPKIGVMKAFTWSQLVVAVAILCFQFCQMEECPP